MTNLEKMNELVGSEANKEQIIKWAYMNRILFDCVHLETEFEEMEKSVKVFMDTNSYSESDTEFDLWDKFLDAEFAR
ncbi:hypothetical protein [Mesobacillus thioparans]|uniref:hypothetical protein n=1 Tax=Mesobacillus thioparans TaxID=370439 RepID=UPI0039EF92C2